MLFSFIGQEFDVKAKCVINATGPFTDALRRMDDDWICNIISSVQRFTLSYLDTIGMLIDQDLTSPQGLYKACALQLIKMVNVVQLSYSGHALNMNFLPCYILHCIYSCTTVVSDLFFRGPLF